MGAADPARDARLELLRPPIVGGSAAWRGTGAGAEGAALIIALVSMSPAPCAMYVLAVTSCGAASSVAGTVSSTRIFSPVLRS